MNTLTWAQSEWLSYSSRARRYVAAHQPVLAPAGIAAALMALVYLSTLMWTITGCHSEYCVDVGEFQVALPSWGTVHFTGYPLYMLLGSPFVAALRLAGITPAAAASLYSLLWESLAVGLLAGLMAWLAHNSLLGLVCAVVVGLFQPIWVHGSLAEVYSLSMALAAGILALTFRLASNWSARGGWLLAFA